MSEPREGLPPCLAHYTRYRESVAFIHDYTICEFRTFYRPSVRYGIGLGSHWNGQGGHPFAVVEKTMSFTDDETEAKAAYEKGAAWVLTGEGP